MSTAITKPAACRNKRHPALGNNPIAGEVPMFKFFFFNSIPVSFLWLLFFEKKKASLPFVLDSQLKEDNTLRLPPCQKTSTHSDITLNTDSVIKYRDLRNNAKHGKKILWFTVYSSLYLLEQCRWTTFQNVTSYLQLMSSSLLLPLQWRANAHRRDQSSHETATRTDFAF